MGSETSKLAGERKRKLFEQDKELRLTYKKKIHDARHKPAPKPSEILKRYYEGTLDDEQ
jgi:hypothetical protein